MGKKQTPAISAFFYHSVPRRTRIVGRMIEDGVVLIDRERVHAKKGDIVYLSEKQPAKIIPAIWKDAPPVYKTLICIAMSIGETKTLSVDIANAYYLDGWFYYEGVGDGFNYRVVSTTQPLLIKGNTLECMGVIKGEPCDEIF